MIIAQIMQWIFFHHSKTLMSFYDTKHYSY